jgi:hypothetical protein
VGVASDVLAGTAEREQHQALAAGVDELAADARADPREAVDAEDVLDPVDAQGQLAREHEKDLFLMIVAVDASALAGLEHDQVQAE